MWQARTEAHHYLQARITRDTHRRLQFCRDLPRLKFKEMGEVVDFAILAYMDAAKLHQEYAKRKDERPQNSKGRSYQNAQVWEGEKRPLNVFDFRPKEGHQKGKDLKRPPQIIRKKGKP